MNCSYCGGVLDDAHGKPIAVNGFTIQGCPKHPLNPQMTFVKQPKRLGPADKLKDLCDEVRRIMTQVTDPAILDQLQEAIDTAEA